MHVVLALATTLCDLTLKPTPSPLCTFIQGFYRWSINAFAFARNATRQYRNTIPKFDEPVISMDIPEAVAPHRVAVVGEALFVHGQVSVAAV